MAFNQNIPAATDLLSTSQGDIQANFQSLYATILANHASFSPNADFGKHTMVQLVPRAAAIAGNPGFWSNSGSANDIMLRNNAGTDVNITGKTIVGTGTAFYLPCGLLIKYGTATTDATNNIYIDLNAIGAAYTATPIAYVTGKHTPAPAYNFVLAAIATNDGAHPTTRYLRVSTHNDASGAGLPNAPFNWMTIGTV